MARKSRKNRNVESNIQTVVKKENLLDTAAYIRLSVENGGNETDETLVVQQMLVERFIEKTEIETEIKDMKVEREKEHNVFLDRVQEIEQVKKNRLESIILKDEDGYDRKVWRIGRATSMLLGKKTPRNKVDVDLGESVYANLVSRAHGVLNLVNDSWYYEDLGSRNGSGLERKRDGRKIKLKSNMPVKVETGDIIYLATTKVLLK